MTRQTMDILQKRAARIAGKVADLELLAQAAEKHVAHYKPR